MGSASPILMGMGLPDRGGRGALCGILSGLCARWREAQDEITRHGSIYKDGEGRIRPNPYIAIANQQMRRSILCRRVWLTPSTRAAMIANVASAWGGRSTP